MILVSLIIAFEVPTKNIQTNTQAVLTLTILPNNEVPEVPIIKNLMNETSEEVVQLNIESQHSNTLFLNEENIGMIESSDGSLLYDLELEKGENEFNLYAQNYFGKTSPSLTFNIQRKTETQNSILSIGNYSSANYSSSSSKTIEYKTEEIEESTPEVSIETEEPEETPQENTPEIVPESNSETPKETPAPEESPQESTPEIVPESTSEAPKETMAPEESPQERIPEVAPEISIESTDTNEQESKEFNEIISTLISQVEESGKISREDKKEFNETIAPLFEKDTDNDGMSDALEYYLGQDPLTEETLFNDEIDIIDLKNTTYTNESILLYGQSSKGSELNIYARDKDLNLHLIGQKNSNSETFAIPGKLPFPGEFTLLLEATEKNGDKEINVKDEIQYKKADSPLIPEPNIQISSSFSSSLQTNVLSFSEKPSIVLDGSSLPLQRVMIVWTQNNKHILTQVLTSPIDGSFYVENPFSTNTKNISAKIQIIDPMTKYASPLIETEYTLKEFELKTHLLIHIALIGCMLLMLKNKSRKRSIINENT